MSYTVGELSRLAGVTVRTLRHYDAIGLLAPSERTPAGYRHYDERDLERLQQVLCYRQLGFSLEEVADLLDDPEVDAAAHLRRQHRVLRERIERLERMVTAVETMMEAEQMGISLTPEERFEVFGDFEPKTHEQETADRWGDTDAYRQSQRRVKSYSKADWLVIKAEATEIERGFVAALAEADRARGMDLAEAHRQHITRWYYDCGYDIHRGLGELYVADERFTAHYENLAPGLASFVNEAIQANADRAGASES
jgi:DNA-binding transcriptional MerR regulator